MIELLIVIIILTTLVSAAIPILAPTNDDRRLREASRGVNSYISAAQMKAVQLQRPFGVAIKRLAQDTSSNFNQPHEDDAVSIELYYVEQPAPYRGFDRTSSVSVARHPTHVGWVLVQFVAHGNSTANDGLPAGWDPDLFPPNLIRPGDVIEIDGTRYLLLYATPATGQARVNLNDGAFVAAGGNGAVRIEARPLNDTGQMLNVEFDNDGNRIRDLAVGATPDAPYWTNPAPYKILRQPMPTSAEPLQLPEGTAIDLRASGQAIKIVGSGVNATATGFFYNPDVPSPNQNLGVDNADTIVIMFTPEGAIERVRFNQRNVATSATDNYYDARTVSNIYLLIGRRQNAPPPTLNSDKTLAPVNYTATTTDEEKREYKEADNWLRSESRWIVIGTQSGRVVTVENAFVDPQQFLVNSPPNDYLSEPQDVRRARQIDASREFAREMVQVGGR